MGQRPRDPNKGIARSASPAGREPAGGSDYAASLNGAQDTSPYARPRAQKRSAKQKKPARRPFARGSVDDARLPGELGGMQAQASARPNLRVVPDAGGAAASGVDVRPSRGGRSVVPSQPAPARRGADVAPTPAASAARPAARVSVATAGTSRPDAPATGRASAEQMSAPAKKPSYGCGNEPFGGSQAAAGPSREELLDVPAVTSAPAGQAAGEDIPSVGADFDDDPSEVFSPYEAPSAQMASKWLTQFFGATPAAPVDEEPLDAPARTQAASGASAAEGQVVFPAGASPSLTLVPGGALRKARPAQAASSRAGKPAPAGQVTFPVGASPALTLVPGGSASAGAERGASRTQAGSAAASVQAAPVRSHAGAPAPAESSSRPDAVAPAAGSTPSGAAAPASQPAPTSAGASAAPASSAAQAAAPAAPGPAPASQPSPASPAAQAVPSDAPLDAPHRRRPHVSAQALARPFRALGAGVARAFTSPDAPRVLVAFVASVVMLLVSVGMLYGPSQELYLAMRQNERLTSELAANQARNDKMAARVDSLQTQEGIEDEARERFGLVLPGENLVRVVGLSSEGDASSSETPAEVKRGSGTNTHTWATDLLDRVFGVQDVGATSAEATDDASAQVSESAGADASVPAAAVEAADGGE